MKKKAVKVTKSASFRKKYDKVLDELRDDEYEELRDAVVDSYDCYVNFEVEGNTGIEKLLQFVKKNPNCVHIADELGGISLWKDKAKAEQTLKKLLKYRGISRTDR